MSKIYNFKVGEEIYMAKEGRKYYLKGHKKLTQGASGVVVARFKDEVSNKYVVKFDLNGLMFVKEENLTNKKERTFAWIIVKGVDDYEVTYEKPTTTEFMIKEIVTVAG